MNTLCRATGRFTRLAGLLTLAGLAGLGASHCVRAEPYIAVQQGMKCMQCHVNPTGGGLRTTFGDAFAQTLMPWRHIDTGANAWTGDVDAFLRVGGDLRYEATFDEVRGQPSADALSLEQVRIYLEASVIPERLIVYMDEQVAPGGALNREAWAQWWSPSHDWYVKAGQMYLPFGFRLQDQTAFVLQTSGINMTTPDDAAEFGYLRGPWDAEFDVSNGTAGGPATHGKQYTGQLQLVESGWRAGVAVNLNDASPSGTRTTSGIFAGLDTGPVAWLAQAELVDDHSLPTGSLRTAAGLLEADWLLVRGNNLKITLEQLAPDLSVPLRRNGERRLSIVYELTPVQFVQLRTGVRLLDGIPQADTEHEQLYFIELHGFF
jgi:hypothetical protein